MKFPQLRLRRLRQNKSLRHWIAEHELLPKRLIQPLFVKEGIRVDREIPSMPGQFQWSERGLVTECRRLEERGVPGVILFGIPARKDLSGRAAYAARGVIPRAVSSIRKKCPHLLVITDVCLCEYLSHGHCGHVDGGRVLNDASVKTLARTALSHARAGAHVVAPSDMMDGRVRAIRETLDRHALQDVPILSYAVKYASGLYAPFRDAAESRPGFGDRTTYQMDAANAREAIREAETDAGEGADMLLVKPALGYGDIIALLSGRFHLPVGCFSVSGEYAMIRAAAERGWLDEKKVVLETHLGMIRAGARFILTYWAKDIATWLA